MRMPRPPAVQWPTLTVIVVGSAILLMATIWIGIVPMSEEPFDVPMGLRSDPFDGELPSVSVGLRDASPPAIGRALVVSVREDGRTRVGADRIVDSTGLAPIVAEHGGGRIHLRVHRDAPWSRVGGILRALEGRVVHIGVRADGGQGSLRVVFTQPDGDARVLEIPGGEAAAVEAGAGIRLAVAPDAPFQEVATALGILCSKGIESVQLAADS